MVESDVFPLWLRLVSMLPPWAGDAWSQQDGSSGAMSGVALICMDNAACWSLSAGTGNYQEKVLIKKKPQIHLLTTEVGKFLM